MGVKTLIEQTRAKGANPGGGAILILISNLAINLMLMMDKKDWEEYKEIANVSRETILNFSSELSILMQDDVDNFDKLMKAYKNGKANEGDFLKASESLLTMIDINLKSLEILGFYLESGKKSILSDAQVSNELLRTANLAALPIIKVNIGDDGIDYESIEVSTNDLYKKNKLIIERRNKWK